MTIVSVSEQFQPFRYLVVSLRAEEDTITTTNIIVSDLTRGSINLVTVERGPQGEQGLIGPVGPAGKDGITFSLLPVSSGGTNNTSFNSGYLISYDGDKLASSSYTIQDIVDLASLNSNAITGIIPGTGLQKTEAGTNTAILDVKIGEGLTISNNQIIVDDTIARTAELSLGSISGRVPISKGGTNNDIFSLNKLIYYNGTKLISFPLNTGSIVLSGSSITIEAGSGLVGGGLVNIPSGSIVLQIGPSADILVEENSISLSETGVPGTYTKVVTDNKGRVTSGSWLTTSDILAILGYTPWHPGNDGSGSGLDADLLDGAQGSFYKDASSLTGTMSLDRLPDLHGSGDIYGTKFRINAKGLVDEVYYASSNDIISSLGYRPLNSETSDIINGSLTVVGGLVVSGGDTSLYDNLPLFGINNPNILPSEPRGFTFNYGSTVSNKTGILAYYPTENQLRLITNIYGSGAIGNIDGNGNSFQDDINGGSASTIYITQNLDGDKFTVLFREIADQLYINTNQEQNINALKKFLQGIDVVGRIRFLSSGGPPAVPPFDLAGNNIKVVDLNADLLDDQDGSYYRNAGNITGSFSYNNVSFDHIQGEYNYIPKFNQNSSPSKTIDSSNIKQRSNGDIEITNDVNLIIGENNTVNSNSISTITVGDSNIMESENSIAIGDSNKVYFPESAAIGSHNIASGLNSIALNYGSITKGKNSVALGSYGLSELENQISFGAFRTSTGTVVLEHGQYSTIAAYLKGVETNGSWLSMSPVIQLPKDKTIAYNIELLINKGLSSGVAHFTFTSGIINNATYRDPNNIANILNTTTVPSSGSKIETYNNSQIRRHTHKWNYTDLSNSSNTASKTQYVWAKAPPAQNLNIDLRYVYPYYFYTPENVIITGVFEKSHDGSLILDIHKPRYFESFTQHPFNNTIVIETQKPHNAVANSLLEANFSTASVYLPPSGKYSINGSVNNNKVAINAPTWSAVKYSSPSGSKILVNAPTGYDALFYTNINATIQESIIYYGSNFDSNMYGYVLHTFLKPNMTIKIQRTDSFNNIYSYRRVITNVSSGTITINAPIRTPSINPSNISGPITITIDDFSAHLFKSCNRLWVDGEYVLISGAQTKTTPTFKSESNITFVNDSGGGDINNPVVPTLSQSQNSSFLYENDAYGNLSFSIFTSKIDRLTDGQLIEVAPLFNSNSGSVDIYAKTDLSCSYSSSLSNYNIHTGIYIRYNDSQPNKQNIRIFDINYKPLEFVSGPMIYELVNGPSSEYNTKFQIMKENNRYFLYAKDSFDYETNNLIPVRIRCSPQNTQYSSAIEQVLYINIQNTNETPRVNILLPSTGISIDNTFIYSLPNNMFIEPDNDALQYSASTKGDHPLPRWLSFDPDSLTLSGTPDQCDVGTYSIDIKAIDSSGLYAFNNIIIEVSGNPIGISNVLSPEVTDILKINSIQLSNNSIPENTKNILVGELSKNGGYDPYIFFGQPSNKVSGLFIQNSTLFRYAQPEIRKYSNIVTISGAPQLFGIGTTVFAQPLPISSLDIGLSNNTKVIKTYRPTIFSGTPISGDLIVFDNNIIPYKEFAVFTGQYIDNSNLSGCFDTILRGKEIDDYSIVLGHGLLQEIGSLLLTEQNDVIDHNYRNNTIDPNTPLKPVRWSKKSTYSKLYDENLYFSLGSETDTLVSDNLSNYEHIIHPETMIEVLIATENDLTLCAENLDKLSGTHIDDRVWTSDKPYRIRRNIRENIDLELVNILPSNDLKKLNKPSNSGYEGLSVSNIDYERSDLYNPHDSWTFLEPLNNSIIYLGDIGSDDLTQLITEDRSHSGLFYNTNPLEYGILATEDSLSLIPETESLNGSRIELSNRYELLESIRVYPDNGKLFLESVLEELICENDDKIVHDYAILANSGSAYILFPGVVSQIKFKYPTVNSYSPNRLQNGSLGYYEDDPTIIPSSLRFSESNFYYSWGKLIPYKLSTNEYAIRLNTTYTNSTTSGLLAYTGVAPDDGNYFPEEFLSNLSPIESGDCPVLINNPAINGMVVKDDLVGSQYSTGIVTFYTSFAANNIVITANKDFNKDLRVNDNLYLYGANSNQNNALLPRTDTYDTVVSSSPNSITVRNLFLYPSSKVISHNGTINLNLDRNHEQVVKSSDYINRIPIKFNSVYNTNISRLPKNYLFDITSISGQKIITTDNLRYLLQNDEYLNSTISGSYTTNGIAFLGSLFHDNLNIYDIRKLNRVLTSKYNNITFEYNYNTKILSFNIPTGIVSVFDNIKATNFQPLNNNMVWNPNISYSTGFKVFKENMSIRNFDDTPDKDFILLERSSTTLQPENAERLSFTSDIFNASASGTCSLDVGLVNRLEQGFILNYSGNISKPSGHNYVSYIDGYSFSGHVPRYHNVISTTGTLNDERVGFASVFNTGSSQWFDGIRSLRRAGPNDIGYTELYHVYSSGFTDHINNIPYINLKGIGSSDRWYVTDTISTSGSNKSLQFLYLGSENNQIRIFGSLTGTSDNNLIITKITAAQELALEKAASMGISSGISPILITGTMGVSGTFDYSISVGKYDTITIALTGNTQNNYSSLQLNTYAENIPSIPALILQSTTPIFTGKLYYPRISPTFNLFYLLPSLITDTKYCNTNNSYNKNHTIYYNGNIILLDNFSSIKSYTIDNEQLRIQQLNGQQVSDNYARHIQKINPSNQYYSITGISLDGSPTIPSSIYPYKYTSLRENNIRYSLTFGNSSGFLPITGSISFIPYYSGTFDLLNYNNIYIQSYGNYTSRWPQDTDGVISSRPITGVYSISQNSQRCYADKLCITISSYLNESFSSLNTGTVYFFDFDSEAASISQTYNITDIISSNKISITTPFNNSLIGASGIVFIIPSKYNIKTTLNPNINNSFINQTLSYGLNTQLIKNTINYFDHDTKKWTHIHHLTKDLSIYSGYPIVFNSSTGTIIYNNKNQIGITNIGLYNTTGLQFDNITDTFTIYSDLLAETLRISTSGGTPKLSPTSTAYIPKIYVSGLSSYRTLIDGSPLLYGYQANSGWNIGLEIIPMQKTGIYPLNIIARDETGTSVKSLTMVIKDRPVVKTTYPTGYFTTSDSEWFLNFDVSGLNLLNDFPGNQGIYLSGSPNDLSYDIDIRDNNTISVQGYRLAGGGGTIPFNTGVWNPVLKFIDVYSDTTLAVGTGTIKILDSLNNRPAFIPTVNRLKNHYYVNISELQSISFYMPVYEQVSNPLTYFTAVGINNTTSISWDGDTNRYIATVIPKNTGDASYLSETKYIPGAQFSYSVNQYVYVDGSQSTVNYNSPTYNFDLTFYRPLSINYYYNSSTSGIYSLDQPWTYEFALQEGIIKHRPNKPPRVKLYNTPSIGDNSNIDLSYKIKYRYNANDNYWIVLLEGKPDIYGKYAPNTGTYNIRFTADDQLMSSVTGSFNITYQYKKSINFIQSNIYTTPNNEFFINADITDSASGDKNSNNIVFQGDNSLNIATNKSNMRFNNNLNIWEYYATGNKLTDKWDARLLIDSISTYPSLTLQCKGISSDKITAIAKVSLLELQNNNKDIVEGLPIKITGINNSKQNSPWTPQSGLIIEQGEKWLLNFKTIFGLNSPQHPPTIILSGTPTICSGYDPRLDPLYNLDLPPNTQLPKCVVRPAFDGSSWNYSFSGDPSCLLSGGFDFSITAIDTDLLNNPIYIEPADIVNTLFTYIPTQTAHPSPIIAPATGQYQLKTTIKPGCDNYLNAYRFGPGIRDVCPIPTGLTGIITSGSLPTGLTFSISYPGPEGNLFNTPYYDNLSSGLLLISGSVLYYPESGSSYNDKFYLTVKDARGLSTTTQITFIADIESMEPNTYFRVYFENSDPVFTPNGGTSKLPMSIVNIRRPDAFPEELVCYSNIPKSKHCAGFPVIYSGAVGNSTDYLVLLPVAGYEDKYNDIAENSFIYFNMIDSNLNDSNYYVKKATSTLGLPVHVPLNSFYIQSLSSITSPHTGLANMVVAKNTVKSLSDLASAFSVENMSLSTEGCILGNGKLLPDDQGRYGIFGLLSPGFSGYLPTGGYYSSSDYFGSGLKYNIIDNLSKYAYIKYTTCPETGFVRFSGIVLPPIYIEITDPPPLANRSYGDDSTTFSLNSRLAYGQSVIERNKPQNERAGNAYYTVTNMVTNSTIQSGSVAIAPQNSNPIRLTANVLSTSANNKGATFRINYSSAGSIFPSTDSNAIPTAIPSIYAWVHKAGFLGDIPTENSFPPITPVFPSSINLVSGQLINYNRLNGAFGIRGLAVGGYIPTDICIGGTCPDGYTNYPYLLSISGNNNSIWSSSSYLPKISGIILNNIASRQFNNTGIIPDSINTIGSYLTAGKLIIKNAWVDSINGSGGYPDINELLDVNNFIEATVIYKPSFGDPQIIDTFVTGLSSGNFDPNNNLFGSRSITINKNYGNSNLSLDITIKPVSRIIDIDLNNKTVSVRHNNLSLTAESNNLVIDKIVSGYLNRYSSILNVFADPLTSLSVSTIDSTGLVLFASGGTNPSGIYQNFAINESIKLYSTIEDNIKIMPASIDSNTEGNFDFLISGRPNILYGQYLYRILTKENNTAPIFNVGWKPKTFIHDCIMNVNKPINIVNSLTTWSASSNSWTVILTIEGGLSQSMKVKIDRTGLGDWTYCGFNRFPNGQYKDSYDPITKLTTITLSSSNSVGWGPGIISSFGILVYDDTGSDTITITRES